VALVLRWEGSDSPRIVVRRFRARDAAPLAYRALLQALWEARRLGARAIVVATDDADVVAQVAGGGTPPPGALGPYLQIRALLHAFHSGEIRCLGAGRDPDADLAVSAVQGHGRPEACADLPLWSYAAAP
jgi:hypothetical protein